MATDANINILAIETSSRWGSLALGTAHELLEQVHLPEGNRHASELMPAIQRLTAKYHCKPNQISEIYLSLGPGSFTGLRIAIAIARAMHQATGCKLLGVPTLDIIAHNAPAHFHYVVPILDAKRSQVFAARYHRTPQGLTRIAPPALVHPDPFLQETLHLAHGTPVAILGEGLAYHKIPFAEQLPPDLWPPQAATVYHLGRQLAAAGKYSDPNTLLPTYIRLPEAEEVYRKKHNLPL